MANAIIITLLCLNIVLQLVIGVKVLDEIEGISFDAKEIFKIVMDTNRRQLEQNTRVLDLVASNKKSVEEVIKTSGQLAETAHQALDHAQTILEENERLRKEMANNEI